MGTAWAETVTMRSGEHPDFTRLVLDIPDGAAWTTEKISDGFSVQIEGATSFEIGSVFDRIPRTRIKSLRGPEGFASLTIVSDCDCSIAAFNWKSTKLVVDIKDEKSFKKTEPGTPDAGEDKPVLPIVTAQRPLERLEVPVNFEDQRKSGDQLMLLEQVIIESLARGATQGLLKPKLQKDGGSDDKVDLHFLQNKPGILVHTSIDRASVQQPIPELETCLPSQFFDLPSWGNDKGFASQMASLRRGLVAEFDKLDPDIVVSFARAYLFYGFGREAKNALLTDSGKSMERSILSEMGSIIDADPLSGILRDQVNCDSPAALWAFLSGAAPSDSLTNRNAILRNFKAMPLHLQRHLGALLSEKFLLIGDFEGAELSLAAGLMTDELEFETAIAQSDIFAGTGNAIEAVEMLEYLASNDGEMTPEALIDLLKLGLENKRLIDPELFELADIFRFERRGEQIAGDLSEVQIKSLLMNKKVARALKVIDEEAESLGIQRLSDLNVLAVEAVVEQYDDMAFLEFSFTYDFEGLKATAQNATASRLTALGFYDQAAKIVAGSAVGDAMMERRYLRAEAELGRRDPKKALLHLLGLSSQRGTELRQRAELMSNGREDIAYAGLENDWRTGNWASLLQGEDPFLQDVSESVLDRDEISLDEGQPLSQGRVLLSEALQTRDLVKNLMTRFEVVQE